MEKMTRIITAVLVMSALGVSFASPGDVYQLAEYQIPVMRMGSEVGFVPKATGRMVNARKPVTAHTTKSKLSDSGLFMKISGAFFGYHNITLGTSLAPVAMPVLNPAAMGPVQSMRLQSQDRSMALKYFIGEQGITSHLDNGYPDGKRVVIPKPVSGQIKTVNAGVFIEGRSFEPTMCNGSSNTIK